MPEYRIRKTGEIVMNLAAYFHHTSIPAVLSANDLDALGVDPVFEGPQAVPTDPYHYSQRAGVEQIGGKWYTKYVLGPVFAEYTDTEGIVHTIADQEAEYRVRKDETQWQNVRNQRNFLLAACDWTQLPDAPLSNVKTQEWETYRQALRDITNQPDPFNIIWPEEPQ